MMKHLSRNISSGRRNLILSSRSVMLPIANTRLFSDSTIPVEPPVENKSSTIATNSTHESASRSSNSSTYSPRAHNVQKSTGTGTMDHIISESSSRIQYPSTQKAAKFNSNPAVNMNSAFGQSSFLKTRGFPAVQPITPQTSTTTTSSGGKESSASVAGMDPEELRILYLDKMFACRLNGHNTDAPMKLLEIAEYFRSV